MKKTPSATSASFFRLFAYATLLIGLSPTLCHAQNSTPRWAGPTPQQEGTPPSPSASPSPKRGDSESASSQEESLRFLSYNLRNYLTMKRGKEPAPKPEREIAPLIELIVSEKPDFLGISEIGTTEDLADLQKRLREKGLHLPHSEHTGGRDEVRHLAFLSRYPITERNSRRDLSYPLAGQNFQISRGLLDITVETANTKLRFLGAHLKSKRQVEIADQELIRQNEALLFRQHADQILKAAPETALFLYGDFNDTIKSKTLRILKGKSRTPHYLNDHYFKDSRGELWTHFWDYQDVYSRFDYVLLSSAAQELVVPSSSYIVDGPNWTPASDHRALLLSLKL